MRPFLKLVAIMTMVGLFGISGRAQTSTGTISGRVLDQSGGVVANAEVQLTNEETNVTVGTKVLNSGDFILPDVQPGTYTVVIKMTGYKELRKQGLRLSASERLSAGTLTLEIGAVTQSVVVSAATTPVQTTSSEVSGLLDSTQLNNLLSVGRDFMGMVKTIPGVVGGGSSSLGTYGTPTINGTRNVMNSGTVDGVSGGPRGGDNFDTPPNLDAIQEVKILTSNYQAEYGAGSSGPVINVVTKGGTSQFHGTAYYYGRNEAFNANDWFNNYNNTPRARYRYNTIGGNIGGPVYWPHRFNTNRDKLFFFYSQEYWPTKKPDGLKQYMVPTALERQGDFSQTPVQGTAGKTLINIKMPGQPTSACVASGSTGNHAGCFPGNKLPLSAINAQEQALLNVMPLPNFNNLAVSAGNYNYITNYSGNDPVYQEIFRIDYAPTEKIHMYFRGIFFVVNADSYSSAANKLPWLMRVNYQTTHPGLAYDLTYAFSPTLLNEVTVGTSGFGENQLYQASELAKATKSSSGYNIGQLYPANNPLNLFPAVSFGGITNAATFAWDSRFPMYDRTRQYSVTDSLTKILGTHNLKFGVDLKTDHYLQAHSSSGTPSGSFNYGTSSSNPNDSYNAFANTIEGLFNTYSEPTARTDYNPRIYVFEGYAQDQWRITPRLTLDYGMRVALAKPPSLEVGGNFVPSLFDPGNAPVLYQPKKVGSTTVAVDPTTNQTYPGAYVGLYVPNTGSLSNGTITTKNLQGYPDGLVYGTGFQVAPRFGFSFDPYGSGKTAIRGGFGVFINPATQIGQEGDMTHNPPNEFVPQQFYGNVDSFLTAGSLLGPPNFGASFILHPKETKVYGMSLNVQQDLGFGTVLSVGYVGNLSRHLTGEQNINEVPYGAEYLPQNQNPASPGTPLPDNFFRPYPGYGSITYRTTNLTANYNSMQVQVTRRFKAGLEFGLAYTWSRSMDYADSYDGSVATYQPLRLWNYGPAGTDHRNNLVVNYLWTVPKGSRLWNNFATRMLLDGWQISGIAYHLSGAPDSISFSTSDSVNLTGGGDGARVYLTGNPMQSAPHTFNQWFNTSVVSRPSQSVLTSSGQLVLSNGVSPFAPVTGPGFTNFDTAVFKNFMVEKKFAVQLRLESYNTLNSPEFNDVNTTAKFNPTGAQTNATFGQLDSDNGARVLQLAGRINF